MKRKESLLVIVLVCFNLAVLPSCAKIAPPPKGIYRNEMVDFAAIQTVAVLPFQNLTDDADASERVRDAFMSMLLATEAVYVLPTGEVARGITTAGLAKPATPTLGEIKTLAGIINVDVVITGVLREYGILRSGITEANVISLSLEMIEIDTGAIIWSASSTKGGVTMADRLFGGGGDPMNGVTLEAVNDLLDKLFQ